MTWFRVGGAGIPATLKNAMNAVFNKKFGTSGQNYPPKQWPDDVNLLGPLPIKNASGAIASFSDGADDVPIASGIFGILPSGGGGTPSAPVPISGSQGMTISHAGKNLFNNTGLFPSSGSVSSYYFKQFDVSSGLIPEIHLKAGVTYTFAVDVTSTIEPFNFSVGCGNGSYSTDILSVYNKNNGRVSITFTPTTAQLSNGDVFAFRCPRYGSQNTYDYTISNVQLEIGSTSTTYEAYKTDTFAVSWIDSVGTVYGGELNVTTGVLTVTYAKVDMGTLAWQYDSTNTRFFTVSLTGVIERGTSGWKTELVCDIYATASGTANDKTISEYASTGYVYIKDTDYTDPTIFKNHVDGHYIVYPLATPTNHYQLTPHEINTFLDVNNLYCDTGYSSINYRADISLALQALQGSRSLSMSLMRSAGPEEASEPEENIQNTEEQEGEDNAR